MPSFEELENMTPTDVAEIKKRLGMNKKQVESTDSDSEQAPEQPQDNPEGVSDLPEQRELLPEDIHEEFQKQLVEVTPVTEEINALLDHVDGLDNKEPKVTERLNGVMSKITETIKHSNLLKAAITAGAFLGPAAAYGGELNGHLNRMNIGIENSQSNTNPHGADLNKLVKSSVMTRFNLKKLVSPSRTSSLDAINRAVASGRINHNIKYINTGTHEDSSLSTVNGAISLSQKAQRESSPTQLGRVHLNPSGRLFTPLNHNSLKMNNPVNSINRIQVNAFKTDTFEKINHFQEKILPGATINGSPAYEIAPGVYGNEHSVYTDKLHAGIIEIN